MKLFRLLTLILAIGVFSAFPMHADAQQEVDPDHYEQAPAAQVNAHSSKAQGDHKVANAHHQGQNHTRLASKHSGKVNHHRTHVAA